MRVTNFPTAFRINFPRISMIILPNFSPNVSPGILLAASPIAANGMV